ncbi:hypothetical protein [Streptomyces sp. NPDC002402]
MSLTVLVLILLLTVVTLLVGVGALLIYRPAWSAPFAGALTAMTLMATVTGLLVALARS